MDVRFSPLSLNLAVVAPLCLKFPHLRDYGMLKPGVSIWAQRSQTRRLTANRIPLVKTDTCTVYSGLNNQQCGISTTWQMSLVHLLGSLLETAVYRPMGNPWIFIQLGLLQESIHTAEPENTDISRDGR